MAVSFKYWDDCVHQLDIGALWLNSQVRTEWTDAGETKDEKVHLSRDPDGQPFLTQKEMRAVAEIVVRRHFHSLLDVDMICAIAELESDRQLLATRYVKKTKDTTIGLMQISTQVASWLFREHGYRAYDVEADTNLLYRPFINVYLGAAYLKWLSNFEQTERSEEFVVRAFNGGTKKATHKSTLPYWRRYVSVKESFPSTPRKFVSERPATNTISHGGEATSTTSDVPHTTWDSRTSPEDMEEMWNKLEVHKHWSKSRKKRGQVNFYEESGKGLYLSRVELKGVAEIILSKHFRTQNIKPAAICAIAEIISTRFVDGVGSRIGLMGIDYSTADWLYKELDYKAYKVESVDDLRKPFVSIYFGTAYMTWLSQYEGRERPPQFVVQAYLVGPTKANIEETCPRWLKFEQALSYYGETKRQSESCTIM